jgi:hypothetical protein
MTLSCANKPRVPAQDELLSFARNCATERRFLLRQNEAQCEAPKFEVFAKGRWLRVFLDGPVSLLAKIEEQFLADEEKVLKLEVKGVLKAKTMTTTTNAPYLLFEVEEICPCKEDVKP